MEYITYFNKEIARNEPSEYKESDCYSSKEEATKK
jgi:hypothetical protein